MSTEWPKVSIVDDCSAAWAEAQWGRWNARCQLASNTSCPPELRAEFYTLATHFEALAYQRRIKEEDAKKADQNDPAKLVNWIIGTRKVETQPPPQKVAERVVHLALNFQSVKAWLAACHSMQSPMFMSEDKFCVTCKECKRLIEEGKA